MSGQHVNNFKLVKSLYKWEHRMTILKVGSFHAVRSLEIFRNTRIDMAAKFKTVEFSIQVILLQYKRSPLLLQK
uniref:Uncharacterized protein n=1 Tax=Ciona intestinalis TaxID=7719 RepID=H2XS92_CIOIN